MHGHKDQHTARTVKLQGCKYDDFIHAIVPFNAVKFNILKKQNQGKHEQVMTNLRQMKGKLCLESCIIMQTSKLVSMDVNIVDI